MRTTHTVAFFTGQSSPERCALSPEQRHFLNQLDGPDRTLLPVNFPYRTSLPYRHVPLARASWNNFHGYFASRRSGFSEQYREDVAALIQQTKHTFFLVGSSGLELFNNLDLTDADEKRCTLICYGPVARRLPHNASIMIVQSSRDYLSRAFFRGASHSLQCDHMGYLGDPKFLRLCQDYLSAFPSTPFHHAPALLHHRLRTVSAPSTH